MIRRRLGSLDCVITGGTDGKGGGDGPMVIVMHGFGASGEDLVSLAGIGGPPGTRWVFPAAPLELGGMYGDARAWWMIDLEDFQRAAAGRAGDRAGVIPPGLAEARAAVLELLDVLAKEYGRRDDKTVIGGFSQGAMLATDVVLHAPAQMAGLAVLSGTLLAEALWKTKAAALAGMMVLQTHGTRDQVLGFAGAEKLRDFFQASGAKLGFASFPGGHELPPPVLAQFADLLEQCLG